MEKSQSTSLSAKWTMLTAICLCFVGFFTILPELIRMSIDVLGFTIEFTLVESYSYFGISFTLLPLIGGCLADAYLGKYKTILVGLCLQIFGVIVILIIHIIRYSNDTNSLNPPMIGFGVFGLVLCATGTSFFLSSAIPFLGMQCCDEERGRYFLWYIWSANVANWFMMWPIPIILYKYSNSDYTKTLDIVISAMRAVGLLIALIIIIAAKNRGVYTLEEQSGKENLEKLFFEIIPSVWRRDMNRSSRDENMLVLRRWLLYSAVILAVVVVFYMIWCQPLITIFYESFDNLNVERNCYNRTNETQKMCFLENEIEAKKPLSLGPLFIIILIPLLQCWMARKRIPFDTGRNAVEEFYIYRNTRRDMLIGTTLGGCSMLSVFIFGACNCLFDSSCYFHMVLSGYLLVPSVAFLALAEVFIMRRVFYLAFTEAQQNLPGLESFYTSLVIMCNGLGGFMACGIYYSIVNNIHRTNPGADWDRFYNGNCRMYLYIVLAVLSFLMIPIIHFASKKFSEIVKLMNQKAEELDSQIGSLSIKV